MIESAPRAGPTRSYLKGGGLKVAVGNRAQLRLFCSRKNPEKPMNRKIVMTAATIAFGLGLENSHRSDGCCCRYLHAVSRF